MRFFLQNYEGRWAGVPHDIRAERLLDFSDIFSIWHGNFHLKVKDQVKIRRGLQCRTLWDYLCGEMSL